MTGSRILVLLVSSAVVGSSAAIARPPGNQPPPPPAKRVLGVVKAVNAVAAEPTITLTVGRASQVRDITLPVVPNARIKLNGEDAVLADLPVGAHAVVAVRAGKVLAINARSAPPTPPTPPGPPPGDE